MPHQTAEDPLHDAVDAVVEHEQIQAEEDRHQDDDHRRRVDFLLRRPGDALQLVAHLAQEQAHPLERGRRPPPSRLSSVVVVSHPTTLHRPAIDSRSAIADLAGQEGIEPPTPGFGDRCSAN